ncbi:HNH endonuclease [Tetragenococcus halophilus]|uniref:HNH endonuclease n=1 Tax=Tetragenococcus halophilus TaxID=51669 RepID=A0A3G5FIM6_TETHA|nr:HNH endonuclease [Tetragenococcus halophilus]AYW50206.1 HNH endonuclease [Tetragenococcus halophilus]GBD63800.1 hypothetical protein TEHD23766T_1227 [Tetragenococcus halophilus subsp. flandriensis]
MAVPSERWFKRMDDLYVEHKLEKNKYLKDELGVGYNKFVEFCKLAMHKFGWLGLDCFLEEFNSKNYLGLHFIRMQETNNKAWKKLSKKVFERDHYTCSYCGQVGGILEVDHIVPFSKGGSDDISNLCTSCRKCNRQKKDKSIEEFLNWRGLNE